MMRILCSVQSQLDLHHNSKQQLHISSIIIQLRLWNSKYDDEFTHETFATGVRLTKLLHIQSF